MASDDLINQVIGNGQYEIRSVLGRGGMAVVYLARQASMNRDVAIKVMTPELADDAQFVARFENEARMIAQLQHPHILPVIDFGKEGKHIYIVMRLVRGGSLDDRLREKALPLRLASRMLTQIASALTFAHEQGIIHRDLKPNNVLLDERNNAYLTDFGIAKMLAGTENLTATGHILGTPAYMAPEQWRGEPVDARTDVYALGVMLYEMVLGQLPFKADTPFTYMHHHMNEAPPLPRKIKADLDPGVEAVILRALSKDPDTRYQSADDLAEDFEKAAQGLPTKASRPTPPEPDMLRTVIGDEDQIAGQEAPVGGTMPTLLPDAREVTPAPRTRAGAVSPATPAPAVPPTHSAAPLAGAAKKGGLPLPLISGIVVVLAALAVIAYMLLGGGDDDNKVVSQPTETPTATDIPTETPSPTATPRNTFATILVDRANVRSGPGMDYAVIGSAARDEEVQVIGVSEDGNWYQVLYGAQLGWISAEMVRTSGNPNIEVIVLPTETPIPTDTPTETPIPTDTPTETPIPTDTPTETPTDTPTETPIPTDTPTEIPTEIPIPTDTPTSTPTAIGAPDRALFLPTEFKPMAVGDLGITLDHPANWNPPRSYPSLGYVSLHPLATLDNDLYPWFRIARGSPEQHLENSFTRDNSSPQTAVENTSGVVPSTHTQVEGFAYPTYTINGPTSSHNNWAWVIVVAPDDWIYITLYVPKAYGYDVEFAQNVLPRMIESIQIDDQPLAASTEISATHLEEMPVRLDGPVLERFDDNTNDWQFADVIDGELIIESPELNYIRWAYPEPYIEGAPAFYGQVTGRLTSTTNFYQMGLVFRVLDGSNFYYFTIDHLQQVLIFKMVGEEWIELVPLTQNTNVQVGPDQTNTFGVLVLGDYFEFYLNGELVGAVVDRSFKTGGMRPTTFTYEDSDSVVVAAFDDFAYLPLAIAGHPSLKENATLPLGTVRSGGATIRVRPENSGDQLGTLDAGQIFVALARTEDNQHVFGYARGTAGWVQADTLDLTLDDETLAIQALPSLNRAEQGTVVKMWPVVWPDDGRLMAYGQRVDETIDDDSTLRWVFRGLAGDVVTLGTTSDTSSLDLYARLLNRDGTVLIENDDDGPGLNPLIEQFTLPDAGVYIIEIQSLGAGGSFELGLRRN